MRAEALLLLNTLPQTTLAAQALSEASGVSDPDRAEPEDPRKAYPEAGHLPSSNPFLPL